MSTTTAVWIWPYRWWKGIQILATPFDLDSVDLLVRLGLNIFKIPSGEITNLPYLRNFVLAGCCLPGATNDEGELPLP